MTTSLRKKNLEHMLRFESLNLTIGNDDKYIQPLSYYAWSLALALINEKEQVIEKFSPF